MSEIINTSEKSGSSTGIFAIFVKVGPKLAKIFAKFIKVAPKLLKSGATVKGVGMAASMGVYSLMFTWQMGLALVSFILIHEYGHLWAMKKCGIKTKGIYLIPGFGGAAVAAEGFKSARNEVYIALMGPLVGLLFIVPMIGLYFLTKNPMYAAIASIMSVINLFNLFPINPLDGGRAMKGLLYSFKGSIGFAFAFVSFFVAIALGYYTGLFLLAVIAVAGLMETVQDYGLNDALARFQRSAWRALGFFVLYSLFPNKIAFDILHILLYVIYGCVVVLFVVDITKSTNRENTLHLMYPWLVIKDVFLGIMELFSVKPEDIKRVETYDQMSGKMIAVYTIAYLLTIALMVGLVLYTANIPGCALGKELLT